MCGFYIIVKVDVEVECNIFWKVLDKIVEIKFLLEERWIVVKIVGFYNDLELFWKIMCRGVLMILL